MGAATDDSLLLRVLDASCEEDRFTEILGWLLGPGGLLPTFLELAELRFAEGALRDVSIGTQHKNKNAKGYPDLAIRGSQVFVLVESKLSAAFTENQPCEYVRELACFAETDRAAALVIVAPEKRLTSLHGECWRRLNADPRVAGRASSGVGGIPVRLISWERVASALEGARIFDPAVDYVRRAFTRAVTTRMSELSPPLTEEHATMFADRATLAGVAALEDLVRDTEAVFKRNGYAVKDYTDRTTRGFCATPGGASELEVWVGTCFRTGAALAISPLIVHLTGSGFGEAVLAKLRSEGWTILSPADRNWVEAPISPIDLGSLTGVADQPQAVFERVARAVTLAAKPA